MTEPKSTTWWRVSGLMGVPKVEPVQVAKETEKSLAVLRTNWEGRPVYRGAVQMTDTVPKVSQLAHHFPDEGAAYLFAVERAERRQHALRVQLERTQAAVAELSAHVLRIGQAEKSGVGE